MVFSSSALVGVKNVDLQRALEVEANAVEVRLKTGEITESAAEHKTFDEEELKKAEEKAAEQMEGKAGPSSRWVNLGSTFVREQVAKLNSTPKEAIANNFIPMLYRITH